jgi:PAS domain S-box-containing protein
MWPISDDELREALRHLPAVIYQDSHEPHPQTLYLSPNADTILGAGTDEHLRDPDLWWRSIDPRDHDDLMTAWTRAYETEEPYTVDYRYLRPDGRIVWLREHATPVRDDDGRVSHWQGVLLDVTTEREARDELTASETRYRDLVEHLPAAVYTLTADDPPRVVYISDAIEEIAGHPLTAWRSDPEFWTQVVHPDDFQEVRTRWNDALASGMPFEHRYRVRHADGGYRWLSERIHPIRRDGEVVGWEGMSFDVTREREASLALRESERRHERLLQQIPGVAFSLVEGTPRRFDYLSPRVQDILGYPRSLWFEDDGFWAEVIHPDDRDAVEREWARCLDEGVAFRMDYRVRHADGHVVWLRADTAPVVAPDGRVERWQGLWLDITETRAAQAAQARLEARYQRLVEQAPAIVLTVDTTGAVRYISPQVEQVLGYPRDRWDQDPFFWKQIIHPDDMERVLEEWDRALAGELPYDGTYRLLRADGTYRWIRDMTQPVREADGTVSGWHGITIDVHELHAAQEAREAAEARTRALLDNVPAVVYEMGPDDERRTLYVSPHIERLLGYSRQEWLDQPDIWTELLHPDDREHELDAHDRHSSTGEPWSREYRLIAADGHTVWVHDQATLAIDAEGTPVWHGVLVDVTSRRDTTELLQITNEELERRVQERTAALEEANELMGLEIAERRRAEKEASNARERYRVLVEHMPAIAYIWRTAAHAEVDPDADYYMSPQIEDVLGYTPEEWHDGACWRTRLHPHDRDAVVAEMGRCEETGDPFAMEFRYFAKDGRIVWIEDHASLLSRLPDGRPALFHGVMLDVTGRKEAEARAAELQERYRQLTEEGPIATYLFTVSPEDPQAVSVEFVSGQLTDVLGDDPSVWIARPERWVELIHPDDRTRVVEEHRRQWSTGGPLHTDYRMIAVDGRIVWFRDRSRCVEHDEQGRPIRFMGTLMDVTDQTEVILAMGEELTRLRSVVGEIPAVTWSLTTSADGSGDHFRYISPQVERLTGYTAEQLLAEQDHFGRMIHPDDDARVVRSWQTACLSGSATWEERWRIRHRDGTVREIHARARRVSRDGVEPIEWVGVTLDVTGERAGDAAVPEAGAART